MEILSLITIAVAFLLISLLTSLASGLHGGNTFSKGFVMIPHIILNTLISLMLGISGWGILLAIIPPISWWVFLRRGPQAKAELTHINAPTNKKMIKIIASYWFAYGIIIAASYVVSWWFLLAFVPTLMSIYFASKLFSLETEIGKKLRKHSDRAYHGVLTNQEEDKIRKYLPEFLAKKVIKSRKEIGNADNVIDERRAIELITGFLPGGLVIFLQFLILNETSMMIVEFVSNILM